MAEAQGLSSPPSSPSLPSVSQPQSRGERSSSEHVASAANQKVFDRFDADKSGLLDMKEVKQALKILLGKEVPAAQFNTAMKKFDADGSGHLDVNEFSKLVVDLRMSRKAYSEPTMLAPKGSILGSDRKLPLQDMVFSIYRNKFVGMFVAFCIVGNFAINMVEKQIDPDTNDLKYSVYWSGFDLVFNIIFLVELVANMWSYGGPVRKFWKSGWNVFDTIIVTVGVLTMVNVLGPPLDKLKLMRAFRVFRLFKRIESLNKIIVALMGSIPGVINAFVVMFVFFCIYAILAVELFRDFGQGGSDNTNEATTGSSDTSNTTSASINATSSRGYILGIEYYGTFMRALYTLFQVMTGESWSEAVARPLLYGFDEGPRGYDGIVVGFFFVSFIILTQIVLINVVVAVLLDKFVSDDGNGDDDGVADVDDKLASLDHQDALGDIGCKLSNIMVDLEKLSTLESTVSELKAKMVEVDTIAVSVTDLRGEIQAVRSMRVERMADRQSTNKSGMLLERSSTNRSNMLEL